MTTIGKICLWLNVLGLAVIALWLLPSVGKRHNDVSTELRASETALESAEQAHRKMSQDLAEQRGQLARQQIGWDKSWTIEPGANEGVDIQDGRLIVNGLGRETGLEPVLDEAGQEAAPSVHVFKSMQEQGLFYVGEFQADQLDATVTVLVPIWQVTQDEVDVWVEGMELPWRFRSLVPAGRRLHIDQLRVQQQRLVETYLATDANVRQAEKLLEQGNPEAEPVAGRPEYSDGLIRAIASEEERRNDLQVTIDRLRRLIQEASQERAERIQRLREYPGQLPSTNNDRGGSEG